jgi:hypothetical protein
VLDLAGLASAEALARRAVEKGSVWMDDLARRHDVRLAMIYDNSFRGIPPGWTCLGALYLGREQITPAGVTFKTPCAI